jgi:hypothetical protein
MIMTQREIKSQISYHEEIHRSSTDYLRNFNEMFRMAETAPDFFRVKKAFVNKRARIKWNITRSRNIIKKLSAL